MSIIVINVHFGNNQQCKLKIFKGTSAEDIMANIRLIANNDSIQCVDKDSNFIALSSSMPNGTDVFVKGISQSIKASALMPKNDDIKTAEMVIYGYADRAGANAQKYSFGKDGVGEPIIFSNVSKNGCCNVGNMLNPKNGIFTAPISGTYSFTVSAWLPAANATTGQLWFHLNGKRQQTCSSPINNDTGCKIFAGTLTTHIKKGDYVDFRMYAHEKKLRGDPHELIENFHHTFVRWSLIRPY